MSIVVKNHVDSFKAEEKLSEAPEEVQRYVKALKDALEGSQYTTKKALKKIKEQHQEIKSLKNKLKE